MRRPPLSLAVCAALLVPATSRGTADHLKCYKIKDHAPRAAYTADLVPGFDSPSFATETGCLVKVPAKLLCIDVQKAIVGNPLPPGAPPGVLVQPHLCYKLKCRSVGQTLSVADQFGSRSVDVGPAKLLCAPVEGPQTPTTSTTTTTLPHVCGNGVIEAPETCDDGNTTAGDGCSATCQLESCLALGAACSASMECCSNNCDVGHCAP